MSIQNLELELLEFFELESTYFEHISCADTFEHIIKNYTLANYVELIHSPMVYIEARIMAFFHLNIHRDLNINYAKYVSINVCEELLTRALFHIKNPKAWGWREPYGCYDTKDNTFPLWWILKDYPQEVAFRIFYRLLDEGKILPVLPYYRNDFFSISPFRKNFSYAIFDYGVSALSMMTGIEVSFYEDFDERAGQAADFKIKLQAYCAEKGIIL